MSMTSFDYVEYIKRAAAKIEENGEYITSLDAITGDGDHFTNLQMGFKKIIEISSELENLPLTDCFKKIGMTMMSAIGGSSGVLYGSAYISAAKVLIGHEVIDEILLYKVLEAMLEAIMKRGGAEPKMKTMIDSIYPAVEAFKSCKTEGLTGESVGIRVKEAAIKGALETENMEAVKGRAYYQANKGVGHIDPGAMTLAYQIEILMDCFYNL